MPAARLSTNQGDTLFAKLLSADPCAVGFAWLRGPVWWPRRFAAWGWGVAVHLQSQRDRGELSVVC